MKHTLRHFLIALAAIILAVAPAALRLADSQPRWALVRLGARPDQEDPNQRLVIQIKQLRALADGDDSILLVLGIIGLLGVLAAVAFFGRALGRPSLHVSPFVASGLCAAWSSRAPPLLRV